MCIRDSLLLHSWCFGENQGRIIIGTKDVDKVTLLLKKNNIKYFILGDTNKSNNLILNGTNTISISNIKSLYEKTLPSIMGK